NRDHRAIPRRLCQKRAKRPPTAGACGKTHRAVAAGMRCCITCPEPCEASVRSSSRQEQRRSCGKEPQAMRKPTSSPEFHGRSPRSLCFAAAGALALTPVLAAPALAQQPQCAQRDAVLERLSATYLEEPVSLGVTAT